MLRRSCQPKWPARAIVLTKFGTNAIPSFCTIEMKALATLLGTHCETHSISPSSLLLFCFFFGVGAAAGLCATGAELELEAGGRI